MIKIFCFLFIAFLSCRAFGQDSTKHLFKPGTLVGKYYGTYDTTAKKDVEALNTRKVVNIDQAATPEQRTVNNAGISQRPQLQVNQNFDPIEVSGTTEAGRIALPLNDNPGNIKAGTITNQAPLQRTVQPVITGSSVHSSEPYRGTRLGSSSPLYNTYRTNDDGAGAITTAPKNGSAPLTATPAESAVQNTPPPAQKSFYRDTRLGSSSPMYNTYRSNDNGAGSVTTNPNKSGGGAVVPMATSDIQPEQAPSDSTSLKNSIRSMEKRTDADEK